MLTPHLIENALTGQFIFKSRDKKESETLTEWEERLKRQHRLHCDEGMESALSLALMVFVGIVENFGVSEDLASEHLGIGYNQYENYLAQFNRLYNQAIGLKAQGRLCHKTQSHTTAAKVFNKYGLVLNKLKYHDLI